MAGVSDTEEVARRCRGSALYRGGDRAIAFGSAPCRSTAISSAWCRGFRGRGTALAGKPLNSNWRRRCRSVRAGDSAQALMDLGSRSARRKAGLRAVSLNEDCAGACARRSGEFPRKAPKQTGMLRRGAALVPAAISSWFAAKKAARRHDRSAGFGLAGWQDDKAALKQAPALKGVRAGIARRAS
jgi:hypothetical protein